MWYIIIIFSFFFPLKSVLEHCLIVIGQIYIVMKKQSLGTAV